MTRAAETYCRARRGVRRPTAAVIVSMLAAALWFVAEADLPPPDVGTPLATVESLHEGLVALAADSARSTLDSRYQALRPLIAATHDLAFIAEFTIRRQWSDLAPAERDAFVAAFERLSVMTYASRFPAVSEDTFAPPESLSAGSARAEVAAAIRRADAEDIPMQYVLHQRDERWLIINIVADGVSDLALKRAEYQRVIADGGVDALIRHIDEQTGRLSPETPQLRNPQLRNR